jgi:hypothetical protein
MKIVIQSLRLILYILIIFIFVGVIILLGDIADAEKHSVMKRVGVIRFYNSSDVYFLVLKERS